MARKIDRQFPATFNRRAFLKNSTVAGASFAAGTQFLARAQDRAKTDDLRFGIIGCGAQAEALRSCAQIVKGIRFAAVSDIRESGRRAVAGRIRASRRGVGADGKTCASYERAEEMLEKEKLDAVIVAVPCFLHHRYTNLCLEAGLHVYCEKLMSNSIENARSMVKAQRSSGKLLQIGHQRRSNPVYLHARNQIIHGVKNVLGWITQLNAQWNRSSAAGQPRPIPLRKKSFVDDALLDEFGYGTGLSGMWNLVNWRMVDGLGTGSLGDLGSHQLDIFNWFMKAVPQSVFASGSTDYFTPQYLQQQLAEMAKEKRDFLEGQGLYEQVLKLTPKFDFPDNAMAIFEYETPAARWGTEAGDGVRSKSRAFYQISSNNGSDSFYEKFAGDRGTLKISEQPRLVELSPERRFAPEWEELEGGDFPLLVRKAGADEAGRRPRWSLPVALTEPAHAAHLRNFVQTIVRGGKQNELNCPAEEAFRTTVTVLKTVEAARLGKKIDLKPEDFEVEVEV